jgi:hypothetical protein
VNGNASAPTTVTPNQASEPETVAKTEPGSANGESTEPKKDANTEGDNAVTSEEKADGNAGTDDNVDADSPALKKLPFTFNKKRKRQPKVAAPAPTSTGAAE